MDIKQLIQWSLKHWWWFAITVAVCMIIAGIRYLTTTPSMEVRAALMLRSVSETENSTDDMMQIMGMSSKKNASDEIKVLTSRNLIGRVVDNLNLCTTYSKKEKGKWFDQFPTHDLTATLDSEIPQMIKVEVRVLDKGYRVKVKEGDKLARRFTVTDLTQPVEVRFGYLHLQLNDTVTQGSFRAAIYPRSSTVDMLAGQLSVTKTGRESNVIIISTVTPAPYRMKLTIDKLLQFYNEESTMDKNILAIQTEAFLRERIDVVEKELYDLETTIEMYKRTQQIANLDRTAANYQQLGDEYKQQVAHLDADIYMMDCIIKQLDDPNNQYTAISGNLLERNDLLETLIKDYNACIIRRSELLQTATDQNIVIIKENELIAQKQKNVKDGMLQNRQKLIMKRQFVLEQQNQYLNRLAAIPEVERHYLELCREKETKENQYVYLIEKREENALLLSATTVPARVVEDAQISPSISSPKLKRMLAFAIFLGLLLPYFYYFFEIFRKEYL